ncbi:hypothetical protein DRQ25_09450 [Candidatus Fermentibacteria bacterium]|nr:MAG: hypothetical protein DRQ25_09450 [Candidatus Fermentibacteria bacterium]
MRYQVVVLASEIGDAINIDSFSWKRSVGGDPQGTFFDMKIYMGLCSGDALGANFDDNYISGTRILVMSGSPYTSPTVGMNEWFEFVFDTPFWYNGQDNLLIEVEWSSGVGSLYSWVWPAGSDRSMYGLYGGATSLVRLSTAPNLRLNGTLSLSNSTFARIKAAF